MYLEASRTSTIELFREKFFFCKIHKKTSVPESFFNEVTDRSVPRSSRLEVFCEKDFLKMCSKFTGEHPRQNLISIKLLCNFIEITLCHGVLL